MSHRGDANPVPGTSLVVVVRWVAVAIGVIAALLVTRRGVVVSPDSTQYWSGAEGLVGGSGLVTPTGDPLVLFPPITSFVYAVGEILPVATLSWVRVLNAVLVGMAIWLTSRIVARHARHAGTAVAATLFASVSVGLMFVGRAAWSEPIYVVVVLVFVAILTDAVVDTGPCEAEQRRRWPLAVAGVVWVAFFTRYAGLVLVPVGFLAIVAFGRPLKLRRAVEFVALAVSMPIVWMLTNRWRGGSSFGERPASIDTLGETVERIVEVMGGWVVPVEVAPDLGGVRLIAGGLICGVLFCALVIAALRRADGSNDPSSVDVASAVAALTALASVAMVGVTQLRTAIDPADARLLAPALLPSVIAVSLVADRVWSRRSEASASSVSPAIVFGAAALAIALGTQGVALARFVDAAAPEPWTFTHPAWTGSETAAAVRALPEDALVWTNNPFAAWVLTDRRNIDETPRSGAYRSDVVVEFPDVDDLGIGCGPTALVWFDRTAPFHHSVARISEVVELVDPQRFSDGEIWTVVPPSTCR